MRAPFLPCSLLAVMLGCTPAPKCASTDYECNLRVYRQDIDRRPPRFSRASLLAQPTKLQRNLQNVFDVDDYIASSMLRVLAEYPQATKDQLCANPKVKKALRQRGTAIRSPFQFQEYAAILENMGC